MILISLDSRGDQHFVQVSVRQPAVMQHIWKLDHFGGSAGVRWSQQYCNVVMSIQQHLQWLSWSGRATEVIVSRQNINGLMQKIRNWSAQSGIILCMRPANQRWCNIVSHWLGTYTKWSLPNTGVKSLLPQKNAVITALAFKVMVSRVCLLCPTKTRGTFKLSLRKPWWSQYAKLLGQLIACGIT